MARVIEARTTGVRSRFYDTEFYPARLTDVRVWEAQDHHVYWDRCFEIADLLVGTESGYARPYGLAPVASITT